MTQAILTSLRIDLSNSNLTLGFKLKQISKAPAGIPNDHELHIK